MLWCEFAIELLLNMRWCVWQGKKRKRVCAVCIAHANEAVWKIRGVNRIQMQ